MLTYDQFKDNDSEILDLSSGDEDEDDDIGLDDELAEGSNDEPDQPQDDTNEADDDSCVESIDAEGDLEFVDEENSYNIIEDEEADFGDVNGVEVIKCAAHTLALGINDTIEKLKMKRIFRKFRNVAKFLRTPNQITVLNAKKKSLPKLDTVVRWNSSYDLMESMQKLKSYCATVEFKKQATAAKVRLLTVTDWTFAQRFLKVFKSAKICTKKLQGEQVTLSDFFEMWNELMLRTKKLSSSERMAAELYKNLTKREENLLANNKPLQAALYLDPRFRLIFVKMRPNFFDESVAQQHLFQLYKHVKSIEVTFLHFLVLVMLSLKNNAFTRPYFNAALTRCSLSTFLQQKRAEEEPNSNETTASDADNDNDEEDSDDDSNDDKIMEQYIRELYADIDQDDDSLNADLSFARNVIDNYKDKQPLRTNVLKYWYDKRFEHPLLYKLSTIVHGVPASQVSVERAFSTLKFILNDYRTRLQPWLLQDIMLVRLN